MLNLQTTVAGMEMTLATLADISKLLARLDERLMELSPELPQVDGAGVPSSGIRDMIAAYEQVFASFQEAARAAQALGFNVEIAPPNVSLDRTIPVAEEKSEGSPSIEQEQILVREAAADPVPKIEVVHSAPDDTQNLLKEIRAEDKTSHESTVAIELQLQDIERETGDPTVVPERPVSVESIAISNKAHRAPRGQIIRLDGEFGKPLKPIEMPAIDYQVGPMICHGASILYAHGRELKKYWPGANTTKGKLEADLPNETWRLQVIDSQIFCIGEQTVSVLAANDLHTTSTFPGRFVEQAATTSNWAGVRDDNGILSVVFRDRQGKAHTGGGKLGAFAGERVFLESADEIAFAAIGRGDLFQVKGCEAKHISNAGKDVQTVGLLVSSSGLLLTNQSSDGTWLARHDFHGRQLRRSAPFAKSISHQPVFLAGKLFVFDDSMGELVTLSVDSLEVEERVAVEGIHSISHLLAIEDEESGTLVIVAENADLRPISVHLHSVKTRKTTRLCPLGAAKADIGFADGHIVVSSTSSMQNLIQVFRVYDGATLNAKAA